MQHSSGRENICDENPVAFLKIKNTTALHNVFFIKAKNGQCSVEGNNI